MPPLVVRHLYNRDVRTDNAIITFASRIESKKKKKKTHKRKKKRKKERPFLQQLVSFVTPYNCLENANGDSLTNDAVAEGWLVRGYRDARGDGTFRTATATYNFYFILPHLMGLRRERERRKESARERSHR
ncbi:hypothetical protein PUN28_005956 [Cardiocondyla obscurior]|uniref:Uncharacterized protein n=1 Tax=Cardiocondyla obscurior TaxID=286306 RepID=A0AAW2G6I1_9HYME